MTGTCVGPSPITSGGNLTGLSYTPGSPGTSYYVTVTASASTGYLVSPASSIAGPQAATSQLNAPTGVTGWAAGAAAGSINVTFTAPTGTAPTSYTAIACTNVGMTANCVGPTAITSGSKHLRSHPGNWLLRHGVTALPPTGYTAGVSAAAGPLTAGTVQLAAPTGVALAYGTGGPARSRSPSPRRVTPPPASSTPPTACTGAGMTGTCVGPSAITTGGNLTGLSWTFGLAWHQLLRNRDRHCLDWLPGVTGLVHRRSPGRHEPIQRTDRCHPGLRHGGRLDRKVTFTAPAGTAPSSTRDGLHRRGQ